MKRVIIVHRWDGSPKDDWYPWLKKELEKRGFKVTIPKMPNSSEPVIEKWVSYLSKITSTADKDTYFVGHSIGCQAILRYLENSGKKIGGAVFVSGWFTLKGLETDEEKTIAKPWIKTSINFDRIKGKFFAIFSDNDPFVQLKKNKEIFETKLGAKTIIEHNKGHFTDEEGVKEISSVLEAILRLSAQKK